jgi:rhamnogalacturonyl hydrolase YesR
MHQLFKISGFVLIGILLSTSVYTQIGTRFPSERKIIKDPVTGQKLIFLTSTPHGDSKIYQTHNQWTSDGQWLIFRSHRVAGEAMAVNERTGEMVQVTEGGIMAMLKQAVEDMHKFQDEQTGMFWQVIDHPEAEGNYLETSGTALFTYAVLKGVRLGYLPKRMAAWAEKAFYGTCDRYLSKNPDGSLQLDGICLVAGLGGKDHRDGSLAYYFSEPVVCNDAKGVGPLVLAYTEMIARK